MGLCSVVRKGACVRASERAGERRASLSLSLLFSSLLSSGWAEGQEKTLVPWEVSRGEGEGVGNAVRRCVGRSLTRARRGAGFAEGATVGLFFARHTGACPHEKVHPRPRRFRSSTRRWLFSVGFSTRLGAIAPRDFELGLIAAPSRFHVSGAMPLGREKRARGWPAREPRKKGLRREINPRG